MATLNITVKVNSADAAQYAVAGQGPRCIGNAARLLSALASGSRPGAVDMSVSSADPVAASGTLTLVSAVATDAITIGTVTLTASSTPANQNQWEIDGADDAADAASLAAAINAHTTLSQVVSASSDAGVVTVTAKVKGPVGNHIPLSSADATITASGAFLSGGAGGVTGTQVAYRG